MITEKESSQSKIAVLCDFDGTITKENVLTTLYRNFSTADVEELINKWERFEISTQEEIEFAFSAIQADKMEMEKVLSIIDIDPSLPELLQLCVKENYYFTIVSDGLKWYIEFILSRFGLQGVQIFANEILFRESGFSFNYPWYDVNTPLQGTSKSEIIKIFKRNGYHVVLIGDGVSDMQASHLSDLLFAKDDLLKYAKENELHFYEYKDLHDVTTVLGTLKT